MLKGSCRDLGLHLQRVKGRKRLKNHSFVVAASTSTHKQETQPQKTSNPAGRRCRDVTPAFKYNKGSTVGCFSFQLFTEPLVNRFSTFSHLHSHIPPFMQIFQPNQSDHFFFFIFAFGNLSARTILFVISFVSVQKRL